MEKRPYWYKVEIRGIDRIQSATAAGSASMNARRSPQSRSDVYSAGFASWCNFASDGRSTVPRATPSSALGNSINRSAYVIHEIRPSPSDAASCVLMSAEICAADTPITAGPIATSTRRTPSSRQSKRGRPSMPIFRSGRTCSASCAAPPMKTPHARRFDGRVAIRREKHRSADDRNVEQHRGEQREWRTAGRR